MIRIRYHLCLIHILDDSIFRRYHPITTSPIVRLKSQSHLETIIDLALAHLAKRLPGRWTIRTVQNPGPHPPVEAVVWEPGRRKILVTLVARNRIDPDDVAHLLEIAPPNRVALVVAGSSSRRTRERLAAAGLNYADVAGNVQFSLTQSRISVRVHSAARGREPRSGPRVKLTGIEAGKVVRALCDFRTPVQLPELARFAFVDVRTAARVVGSLARDGLVLSTRSGRIDSVDWEAVLRRWSASGAWASRRLRWYASRRGLPSVVEALRTESDYVVSGPVATNAFAPIATSEVLLCYARDSRQIVTALDLQPSTEPAQVAIPDRFDDVAIERAVELGGLRVAAPSQILADLFSLGSLGETAAPPFTEWMRENETVWRNG
jgi:hypothetical protein